MSAGSVLPFGVDELPLHETADDSAVIDSDDDNDDSYAETENEDSSSTTGNQEGSHDWESDDNPYRKQMREIEQQFGGGPDKLKERFTGLQRTVQEKEEARRAEEAKRIQLEDAFFQSQIATLEPAQQQAAWMQLQGERQRQFDTRQMQERQQQVSSYEQMLDGMARAILVNDLSMSHGVPKEKLARFNDPEMMVAFAEEYKDLRKQSRRDERRTTKVDRFEGGGAVSRPKGTRDYKGDLDAAALDFANLRIK